jgi:hypothetical protein
MNIFFKRIEKLVGFFTSPYFLVYEESRIKIFSLEKGGFQYEFGEYTNSYLVVLG